MAVATGVDLESFVASEYPRVVAAVRLITGDREGAADAVQDAIVQLLSKPPLLPPTNYAAWVTVVASNKARDARRRSGAESRAVAKLDRPREGAADVLESLDVDVKAALESLPQQQRQVSVLHYLMDQSIQQIGDALGVSEGTVKTQLHRARQAMAARLKGHVDG